MRTHARLLGSRLALTCGLLTLSACGTSQRADGTAPADAAVGSGGTAGTIDGTVPSGATVLLDTEWKILSDGRLIVKQVRPFLRK